MRGRARLREGPLAELFRATEVDRQRRLGRAGRDASGQTWVAISIAAVGIVAVAALTISAWQLARSGATQENGAFVPPSTIPATTNAGAEPAAAATAVKGEEQAATTSAAARTTQLAQLVLKAARGDCWLEVRVRSATGKLLFAGTLEHGRSLRFLKKRLWLSFGAGGNLDVTLNGRRIKNFPTGTATVAITAKGMSSAPNGS